MDNQTIIGIAIAAAGVACAVATAVFAVKETKASQIVEEPAVTKKDKVIHFVKRYPKTLIFGALTAAILVAGIIFAKQIPTAAASACAVGAANKYLPMPKLIDIVTEMDENNRVQAQNVNEKMWFKDDMGELFEATPFEMLQNELNFNKMLSLSDHISVYDMHKMYGIPDKKNPFRINHSRGFSLEMMFDCYNYPWLSLDYIKMNDPEKGNVDYNVNNGKPYYLIEYSCPVENNILE